MNLSSGYDSLFYGIIISTCIFGVTLCQLWNYINTNWDTWRLRLVIAILYSLNIATTILEIQAMRSYFWEIFENEKTMQAVSPFLPAHLLVSTLTTFLVEIFFAFRLFLLKYEIHPSIPLMIIVTTAGATIGCIYTVVESLRNPSILNINNYSRKVEAATCSGLYFIAEVIATAALALSFRKNKTGVVRTDAIIRRLFMYTLTRFALLSIDQLVMTVLYLFDARGLKWMPFYFSLNKMYVSTMMAMLNSRPALLQDMDVILDPTQVRHPAEEMNISRDSPVTEEVIE